MAGTIIADFIRTDANQLSLNVGNLTFATINASGFFSNTGTQLIAANGKVSGASLVSGSITSAAFATAANTIPRSSMTTGAVLQVVNSQFSNWTTTTSTSFVTASLAASITPTSSTSKILISITLASVYNASSVNAARFRLYKNGSFLAYLDDDLTYGTAPSNCSGAYTCLDTSGSTSSTTYTVYFASYTGATIGINNYVGSNNLSSSSINLMEIAA
jgi:hypothetical protein